MKGSYDDYLQWPFKELSYNSSISVVIIIIMIMSLIRKTMMIKVKELLVENEGDDNQLRANVFPVLQLGYSASTISQYLKEDCLKFNVI